MNIIEAVKSLDPQNDDHWTSLGLPQMKVIEELVGDESITRKDVTAAVGDFKRGDTIPEEEKPPQVVEVEKNVEIKGKLGEVVDVKVVKEEQTIKPGQKLTQAQHAALYHSQFEKRQEARRREERENQIMAVKAFYESLTPEEQKIITNG